MPRSKACTLLRLPTVRDRYDEIAAIAGRQQASCKGFLAELLSVECDDRDTRRKMRLVREAGFPRPKRIELSGVPQGPSVTSAIVGQDACLTRRRVIA